MSVTLNQPRASLIHISPEPQKFENTGFPQNPIGFVGRGNAAKQAIEFIAYKFGASTACVDDGAVRNRPIPQTNGVNYAVCENLVKYSNTQAVICLFIF